MAVPLLSLAKADIRNPLRYLLDSVKKYRLRAGVFNAQPLPEPFSQMIILLQYNLLFFHFASRVLTVAIAEDAVADANIIFGKSPLF